MLIFCPHCGNMLTLSEPSLENDKGMQFKCDTCPYHIEVAAEIRKRHKIGMNKGAMVVYGEDTGKGKQKASVPCEKCNAPEVVFHTIQMRSGDEASTIFYTCLNVNCKHTWKEQ